MILEVVVERVKLLANEANGIRAKRLVVDVNFNLNREIYSIKISHFVLKCASKFTFATDAKLSETRVKKIQNFMIGYMRNTFNFNLIFI